MTQTLIIPGKLPGLNEIIAAANTNRFGGNRLKRSTQERIGWAVKACQLKPMTTPVAVSIAWHEPSRRRDPDNIAAGVKFILDALVDNVIIPNDGQRHITGIEHEIHTDRAHPRVVVTLTEVDE